MERFFPTFRKTLVLSLCLIVVEAFSQEFSAGINTESPNPNAVLHLVSPNGNQGLMLPKLTNGQRSAMALTQNDNGLLVYDADDNVMYYWLNTGWRRFSTRDELVLELVNNQLSIQNGNAIDLSDYLDNTDDQTANEVAFDNTNTNYTSTTVQGALGEIYSILVGADLTDDQTAGDVPYDNATSGLAASDLQGAVDEISANMTAAGLTDDQQAVEVPYDNATSGLVAADVQGAIDELASGGIADGSAERTDLISLSGVPANSTHFGTAFTGTTIGNNASIFGALQQLETAVESMDPTATADLNTLTGVPANSTHFGTTFTGTTIGNNATVASALQNLETELESLTALDIPDLHLLTGVPANSKNFGNMFTGATIGNNATVASALQDLETAVEAVSVGADDQTLSLAGTTLSIVDGNSVDLATINTDNQNAASVPFTPDAGLTSTDVQAAILEVQGNIGASSGDMLQATYDVNTDGTVDNAATVGGLTVQTAVPAGAVFTDNQAASAVPVTPAGNLAATDVQAALVELQTDIDGATGDMQQSTYDVNLDGTVDDAATVGGLTVQTAVPAGAVFTDNQSAAGVPVTPSGNLSSTDVQSALTELQTDIDGIAVTDTDDQTLSFDGANLTISEGNTIDISTVDTNTQLDEATVDSYVSNNGYLTTESQNAAAVPFTPDAGLSSTDVQAAILEVQGNIGAESDPTVPASIKDGIDWTEVSGKPVNIDTDATDDLALTTNPAAGDVSGNFSTGLTVDNVAWANVSGVPVNLDTDATDDLALTTNPAAGDVSGNFSTGLTVDNVAWANVSGVPVNLDTDATDDLALTTNPAAGDVSGNFSTGLTVDNVAWANVSGVPVNLDTDATDDLALTTNPAAGDVSGNFSTGLTVDNVAWANVSGVPVNLDTDATDDLTTTTNPAAGDVSGNFSTGLTVDNVAWANVTGVPVNLDTDATDDVATSSAPAAGDISGNYSTGFAITAGVIENADVAAGAAIAGTKIDPDFGAQQIVAQSIDIGPGVANIDNLGNGGISNNLTVGNNLSVSGTINANANIDIGPGNMSIDNSGNVATSGAVSAASFTGDGSGLTGVTATIAANSITSTELSANAVSTTELAANSVTTNEIVDGTISNADIADVDVSKITGAPNLDTDATDDLTTTTNPAAGDVSGNFSTGLTVDNVAWANVTGVPVNLDTDATDDLTTTTNPAAGDVSGNFSTGLTVDNVAWANVTGVPVNLDTDATDDLTTTTNPAAGDVSGNFSTGLTVDNVAWANVTGVPVNLDTDATDDLTTTTNPAAGDVSGNFSTGLTVDNVAWANVTGVPVNLDTDATDDLTTTTNPAAGDVSGNFSTGLTVDNVAWANVTGVPVNLDTDATDDLTTTTNPAAGDVSGNFSTGLTVDNVAWANVTGVPVNLDTDATDDLTTTTNPAAGDVSGNFSTGLTVDNVAWANVTGVPVNLDTDATDDLTITTNPAAGDVSGNFSTGLTVDNVAWANLTGVPVNLDTDASDDFDGDFNSLTNIPLDLADGDDLGTDDQGAFEVPFNNATSGMTATDVQGAIDELDGRVDVSTVPTPSIGIDDYRVLKADNTGTYFWQDQDATSVGYNNGTSGLASTDIQGAIDELDGIVDVSTVPAPSIGIDDYKVLKADNAGTYYWQDQDATSVGYNNGTSGLASTDIQGAIDELDGIVDVSTVPAPSIGIDDYRVLKADNAGTYYWQDQDATSVGYNNGTSGLASTDIQGAIDELDGIVDVSTVPTPSIGIDDYKVLKADNAGTYYWQDQDATSVGYNNGTSGLASTDIQGAIDELDGIVDVSTVPTPSIGIDDYRVLKADNAGTYYWQDQDATSVGYNNGTSGLASTDIQGAIDELDGIVDVSTVPTPSIGIDDYRVLKADNAGTYYWQDQDATSVGYNNGTSGLASTDIQGAIDELDGIVDVSTVPAPSIGIDDYRVLKADNAGTYYWQDQDATSVGYNNVTSGLASTDIQGAIDELDGIVEVSTVPAPSIGVDDYKVLKADNAGTYAWEAQSATHTAFDDTDLLVAATNVQQAVVTVDARTDSLRKFIGTVAPATAYSTFPGTIIGDNSTIKDAFQDLELATDSLVDLTGVPPTSRDLGFFTGSILESDLDIKQAFQALADTIQTRSSSPGGESFAYDDQQFNQFIGPDAGDSTAISGMDNLLVGGRANVLETGFGNTIVGQDANVNSSTTSRGTAVGYNAIVHADTATAIGNGAEAFGYGSVALGSSARVTSGAYNAVAIGSRTRAVNPQTIVLGDGVTSPAYRVGIGTNDPRTDLQIGDNFGLFHYYNSGEGIDAQVIAENVYNNGENLFRREGQLTSAVILEDGNFDIMSFGTGAANSLINLTTDVQPLFELDSIGDAELRGSLRLGSYQGVGGEKPGMMQWNGGTIEVYNGSTWNPLGGGAAGGDSIYTDSNFNQFVGDFSGDSSSISGNDNLLVGGRNSVLSSGWGNVIVGQDANVYSFSTSRGTALGYRAVVDGDTAVAVGNEAQAYSYGSIAIGSNAYVDFGAHNSVALGAGTFVDAPHTVKIGNGTNAQYQVQIGDSLNLFHYENGDIYGEFFTDKIAWDPGSNNLYMTDNGYASAFSINDGFYTFLAVNGSQGQYLNPTVDIDTAFIVTPWGDAGIAGGFFLGEMQTTPSASDEGILQYNFSSKELELWNGTVWESINGSGAPTGVEALGDFDNNYLIGFGDHDEFGANILTPSLATQNIFIGGGRSGNNVLEDGSKNIIIGSQANVMLGAMNGGVALGVASKVSGDNSIAIGHLAEARATNSIAIGYGAANDAAGAIALGDGAVTGGSAVNAVAIGSSTFAPNANTIILGDGTNSFFDVGIGVNSPTQKLDVNGNIQSRGVIVGSYDGTIATAPLGAMYFDGSTVQLRTSGGWLPITDGGLITELFDDNNNLIVGPVPPPESLPGGAYQLGVTGEGANKPFLTASGFGTIPEVRLSRTNGTQALPSEIQSGNVLGEMVFTGLDGGGAYPIAGAIRASATENWGPGTNLGTSLSFSVIPNGGNATTEVMKVDGDGVTLSGNLVSKPHIETEFSAPPTSRIVKYNGPANFYNNIPGGKDGQELIIMNISGNNVTFEDLPAGNLQLQGAGNLVLTPASTLHLVYSVDLNLWLELSRSINQ